MRSSPSARGGFLLSKEPLLGQGALPARYQGRAPATREVGRHQDKEWTFVYLVPAARTS